MTGKSKRRLQKRDFDASLPGEEAPDGSAGVGETLGTGLETEGPGGVPVGTEAEPVPVAADEPGVDPAPDPSDDHDEEPPHDEDDPVTHPGLLSEEAYVAREVEITKALMENGGLKEAIGADGSTRMQRTERYARWRYRGYLAGEINTL